MSSIKRELLPISDSNIRVGLLGGSFNPAHSGHIHISLNAIELLNLDYVIWLVSPQNPLKYDMRDSLDRRMSYAKLIARNDKIIISDVEKFFHNTYTADTIRILQNIYPRIKFIWMMGADNMIQIHRWHNWRDIFDSLFVAVFDREEYANEVLASEAAKCYKMSNLSLNNFKKNELSSGSWYFFRIHKSPLSSTVLRDICHDRKNVTYKKIADMKEINSNVDYLKDIVLSSLDHDQADDIKVCDLLNKADFARYMIIVSGRSSRHISSMIENLMDRLKSVNIGSSASGVQEATWILLDAGDIIVNAFLPEYRSLYKLEELWGKG